MSIENLIILIALINLGSIAGFAYLLYHKLSLAIDLSKKHATKLSNNTISQVESLLSLYAEIKPSHGLVSSRGWTASPDFLHILTQFVAEESPHTVIECSSGLSTVILAYCMRNQGNGQVFSLEHDPIYAEKTRALLHLHELENYAQVVDAPLIELTLKDWSGHWYDISGLPKNIKYDMLVIDGPPWDTTIQARYPAVPVFSKYLSENAIVVMDDADRADETKIANRWEASYSNLTRIEYLDAEKGVVAFSNKPTKQ